MPQKFPAKTAATTYPKSILYAGIPLIKECEVLTATEMYPGRLVEHDTNAGDIKVAATNSVVVLGVLDREGTELVSTIYHAGDQARVLSGPIIVWMLANSGATIAVGTAVQTVGGTGKISQYATATACVGRALAAKTGDNDEWILVDMSLR
jgi:hypothetical protein